MAAMLNSDEPSGNAKLGQENARLKTELQNWMETAMAASQEGCGDEVHCTCVGPLRELVYLRGEELAQRDEEIERLKSELAAARNQQANPE